MSGEVFLAIPAGGQGLRMGGDIPKQFRNWGGRPLLKATLEAFFHAGMPPIAAVALAVPPDWLEQVKGWQSDFPVPILVVPGGASRQASVAAALNALPQDLDRPVLIHDAVRPFPPAGEIRMAILSLETCEGAVLVEPSTDTLKRVDEAGMVVRTEPREQLFRAQTPQVSRLRHWMEALAWADASGFHGTDDVSLLEGRGFRVRAIVAGPGNAKMTTAEDWHRHAPQHPCG